MDGHRSNVDNAETENDDGAGPDEGAERRMDDDLSGATPQRQKGSACATNSGSRAPGNHNIHESRTEYARPKACATQRNETSALALHRLKCGSNAIKGDTGRIIFNEIRPAL